MPHLEPTYLRYIYDGLIKGSIHPENAAELPDGLIGMYEEAFDERQPVQIRQQLLERFAIWALLKKEVSTQFVAEVLNQPEAEIQDFISTYSAWFNSPESGKYQLYHERLKVYLLQKLCEGEVHSLHEKLITRLERAIEAQKADEFEWYGLEFLSRHISAEVFCKNIPIEKHEAYSRNLVFRSRQIEISKKFEWSVNSLKEIIHISAKLNPNILETLAVEWVELDNLEKNNIQDLFIYVFNREYDLLNSRIISLSKQDESSIEFLYLYCFISLLKNDQIERQIIIDFALEIQKKSIRIGIKISDVLELSAKLSAFQIELNEIGEIFEINNFEAAEIELLKYTDDKFYKITLREDWYFFYLIIVYGMDDQTFIREKISPLSNTKMYYNVLDLYKNLDLYGVAQLDEIQFTPYFEYFVHQLLDKKKIKEIDIITDAVFKNFESYFSAELVDKKTDAKSIIGGVPRRIETATRAMEMLLIISEFNLGTDLSLSKKCFGFVYDLMLIENFPNLRNMFLPKLIKISSQLNYFNNSYSFDDEIEKCFVIDFYSPNLDQYNLGELISLETEKIRQSFEEFGGIDQFIEMANHDFRRLDNAYCPSGDIITDIIRHQIRSNLVTFERVEQICRKLENPSVRIQILKSVTPLLEVNSRSINLLLTSVPFSDRSLAPIIGHYLREKKFKVVLELLNHCKNKQYLLYILHHVLVSPKSEQRIKNICAERMNKINPTLTLIEEVDVMIDRLIYVQNYMSSNQFKELLPEFLEEELLAHLQTQLHHFTRRKTYFFRSALISLIINRTFTFKSGRLIAASFLNISLKKLPKNNNVSFWFPLKIRLNFVRYSTVCFIIVIVSRLFKLRLSNEFKNPHFFEIPSLDKSSHLDEVYSKESHRLYEALHVNEMNSEIVNILRSIEIIKFFNDQKNRESEIKALNIEWLLNDFTNYN